MIRISSSFEYSLFAHSMALIHSFVDVNKDVLLYGPSSFDLNTYLQFYTKQPRLQFYTKQTRLHFYLHINVIQLQVK
jgi:hypothetical protein